MPLVVIKMMQGLSVDQKGELAAKLAAVVVDVLGSGDASVSVAIENVPEGRWKQDVFGPEIKLRKEILFKKPGYASFE
jgi:4-oxalocrotonate tautomerase